MTRIQTPLNRHSLKICVSGHVLCVGDCRRCWDRVENNKAALQQKRTQGETLTVHGHCCRLGSPRRPSLRCLERRMCARKCSGINTCGEEGTARLARGRSPATKQTQPQHRPTPQESGAKGPHIRTVLFGVIMTGPLCPRLAPSLDVGHLRKGVTLGQVVLCSQGSSWGAASRGLSADSPPCAGQAASLKEEPRPRQEALNSGEHL